MRVEVCQRLVQQNNARPHRQAPRECHALALTAGELCRPSLSHSLHAHCGKCNAYFACDIAGLRVAHPHRITYVLRDRHMRP